MYCAPFESRSSNANRFQVRNTRVTLVFLTNHRYLDCNFHFWTKASNFWWLCTYRCILQRWLSDRMQLNCAFQTRHARDWTSSSYRSRTLTSIWFNICQSKWVSKTFRLSIYTLCRCTASCHKWKYWACLRWRWSDLSRSFCFFIILNQSLNPWDSVTCCFGMEFLWKYVSFQWLWWDLSCTFCGPNFQKR